MSALATAPDYSRFLHNRQHSRNVYGFTPKTLPGFLFDFQRDLVTWAVERGRAAIFADCGMGKTPMQLVWAQNVVEHTNRRVLILCPLAVALLFWSFLKNRLSISMWPNSPRASLDVPNSMKSLGAAVAVVSRRYGTLRRNRVTSCRVAPLKLLRMDDSSQTTPAKSSELKWCSRS